MSDRPLPLPLPLPPLTHVYSRKKKSEGGPQLVGLRSKPLQTYVRRIRERQQTKSAKQKAQMSCAEWVVGFVQLLGIYKDGGRNCRVWILWEILGDLVVPSWVEEAFNLRASFSFLVEEL